MKKYVAVIQYDDSKISDARKREIELLTPELRAEEVHKALALGLPKTLQPISVEEVSTAAVHL